MAFIPNNMYQQSNNPSLTFYSTGVPNVRVPLLWGYGTLDAIATVIANNYFTPFSDFFIPGFTNQLGVGDIINCSCSDGAIQLTVTAVANGIITTAVEVGAGSVDTAAIQDLAVTAAKLAADSVTTAKILAANVTLAKLAAGITPSHVIKFAGQLTTVGGAAAEAFAVAGAAAATDRAFVQIVDNGTANVTVLQAVVTANVLTVTFSGNPGADTIFNYQLIRAAA